MDSYLWHNMDLLSIFILVFYPSIFGSHVYFLKPGLSFLDNLAHLQKQSVIVLFTCIADACFLFVAFVGYFQASEGHTWGHPNMLSSSMSWLRFFYFISFPLMRSCCKTEIYVRCSLEVLDLLSNMGLQGIGLGALTLILHHFQQIAQIRLLLT